MENPSKRIVVLLDETYPATGGHQNLVADLIAEFNTRENVEIGVLCREVEMSEVPEGVNVYPILKASELPKVGVLIRLLLNWVIVTWFLARHDIDVVHAHRVYSNATYGLPTRIFGIPLVCTSHGSDIQVNASIGYGERLRPSLSYIIRFTLQFCTLHTVVSKSMIDDALAAGSTRDRVRVVPNGIDFDAIPAVDESKADDESFHVLYLGRLIPKKRPLDVVEAMRVVCRNRDDVHLSVAGTGPLEQELGERVSECGLSESVTIHGYVSEHKKWELFTEADVFVLPSETEAFGLALIEAMACNATVITTDTGPFPEIVDIGETGYRVPLGDTNAIADRICHLANNPDQCRQMGTAAASIVRNRYRIEHIAEHYLEIYDEAQTL